MRKLNIAKQGYRHFAMYLLKAYNEGGNATFRIKCIAVLGHLYSACISINDYCFIFAVGKLYCDLHN